MSEQQITGVCTEIAQKPGNEWVEFHVDGGGQYPVRLSTKKQPLIELGRAAGQQIATWTYNEVESDRINEKSGKPYVNRYLERVEVGGAAEPATAQPQPGGLRPTADSGHSQPSHPPLIAGDKDRAITRMSCLKSAVELYSLETGTLDDVANDVLVLKVMETAGRFERWVYRDIDEVPFS